MIPNSIKANILRSIANGATLTEASKATGVRPGSARMVVSSLCRQFHLRSAVEEIQKQPQKYLDALTEFENQPRFELRKALVSSLVEQLRLQSPVELTPQYLSNITASQLLERGFTTIAIVELQEWLYSHNLCLKRRPPETQREVQEVQRAIALLHAFHFDTDRLQQQLDHLRHEEKASTV